MKKFLNFFEKYGLVKLVGSFVLAALCIWLSNATGKNVFKYLMLVPAAYIIIAFLLFFGAGIWNSIKDLQSK